jgi:hypothetical protein
MWSKEMRSNTEYKILYQQVLAVNSYLTTIPFPLPPHEPTKNESKVIKSVNT